MLCGFQYAHLYVWGTPWENKPIALCFGKSVHSASQFIMLGIVVSAALGILPIAISAPFGALLMIFSGCLAWRDATNALSAQVILIVAASLALGVALTETGGADYLAKLFLAIVGGTSPTFVISGLMLLMGILTNIVSDNAAAVIGTPIALSWLLPTMCGIK